jgi:hypothetical protein
MPRLLTLALLGLLLAGPLAAQLPDGLMMRIDRSTNAADPDDVPDVGLEAVPNGFRVTTGPAATIWDPANTATGTYSLSGRFTLLEPSSHRNFYGLVFGGRNLSGENQRYLYFMVAQTGDFVVIHRIDNANTQQVQTYTNHDAVRRPDANGQSVNDLEVRVRGEVVDFLVNGTVVHSAPREGPLLDTNGIYGVRINHVLPGVVVENLRLTPLN